MRALIVAVITAVSCVGCLAPSKGFVTSTTVLGLELSYSPDSYSPSIRVGLVAHDLATIPPGARFQLERSNSGGSDAISGTWGKTIDFDSTGAEPTADSEAEK